MVKAAEYYPSLMSLMCNGLRFLPCFVKMRQLIDDGQIGRVTVCEVRVQTGGKGSAYSRYDLVFSDLLITTQQDSNLNCSCCCYPTHAIYFFLYFFFFRLILYVVGKFKAYLIYML